MGVKFASSLGGKRGGLVFVDMSPRREIDAIHIDVSRKRERYSV